MRTFQRAFMRAKVGIKHTEGFNPHAYISIILPLALGCESICEVLDVEITDQTPVSLIPERLNPCLPEGIEVVSAFEPIKKPGELKYLRFRSKYMYEDGNTGPNARHIKDKLHDFFRHDTLAVIKKTKRRQSAFDLKPYIKTMDIRAGQGESLTIEAVVSAQNPSVSPALLRMAIDQLEPSLSPSFFEDKRIEIYDSNMNIFK